MELIDVLDLVRLALTRADVSRAAKLMTLVEMSLGRESKHDFQEVEGRLRDIQALSDAAANGFSLAGNQISEVAASIVNMQAYTDDGRRSRAVVQVSLRRVF